MRSRAALATATCLAALTAAAGCSGGEADPKVLPTLSPSTSVTPTSVAVEVPAAARARTPQGAAAFARFFMETVNRSFATADSRLVRVLSDPACGSCSNFVATADQFRADQQHIAGDAVVVESAEAPPEQNGVVEVAMLLHGASRAIVDSRGKEVKRLAAEPRYRATVFVRWTGSNWVARAVQY